MPRHQTETSSVKANRRRFRPWRWLLGALVLVLLAGPLLALPWRWIAPPTSAFMLADSWQNKRDIDYRWTRLENISSHLAISVVASEDQKFPTHYGFDFDSIADALSNNNGRPRGASTISQQVAKNLYLWGGRSYLRKAIEAYLTLSIESLWPKQRILEVYLNLAEFAPGIYGAEAASRHFFNKSADRLNLYESSLLASVLPNPKKIRATPPSAYVVQRAWEIRREVRRMGGTRYLPFLPQNANR